MIRQINWKDIVNMLTIAQTEVFLIMPAIHEEWVEALKMNPNIDQLPIFICIDNSEKVIRDGYGSLKGIEELITLKAVITECPGLRISFISADDQSYFLFMESRIIAGDPEGMNAVIVHPEEAGEFVNMFFKGPNATTDQVSKPLVQETFAAVKKAIMQNPPEAPDLKRRINTYTTLFQYMEVHFEGANLQSATVTIPPSALPFRDEELKKRMKTKYNLFTKEQTDKWQSLLNIKQKVELLRKEFLTPCNLKKNRSILKKERRTEFLVEFDKLKKAAEETTKTIINDVQQAIQNSKVVLKKEWTTFFEENEPTEIKATTDRDLKKSMIEDYVNAILSSAKIPSAHELISKMKLEKQDAEFTVEDLGNEQFLKWFKDKGLITESDKKSLANFDRAFQLKS